MKLIYNNINALLFVLVLAATSCSKPIDRHFQDKMIGRWRNLEKPYDTLSVIQSDSNKLLVKYQGLEFPAEPDTMKQMLLLNAGTDVINFYLSHIDNDKLHLAGQGEFERIDSRK
jgi:hypothetical protein